MSLSTEQKIQIKSYLGYGLMTPNSNTLLNDLLDEVDGYIESHLENYLTQLTALEAILNGSARSTAGLLRANNIEFAAGKKISEIKELADDIVRQLAQDLGVKVKRSPFSNGLGVGAGMRLF